MTEESSAPSPGTPPAPSGGRAGAPPASSAVARGIAQTVGAQAYGILSGLVVSIFLPRMLSQVDYGNLVVVNSIIFAIQMVVMSLFQSALAKFVADAKGEWRALAQSVAFASGLALIGLFVLIEAMAPWIARTLNDPGLTPYLRIYALVIPFHGMFSVLQSVQLGRKQYRSRMNVHLAYWTSKLGFTLGLVAMNPTIETAIVATLLSAVVAAVYVYIASGTGLPRYTVSIVPLWQFSWTLTLSFSLLWLARSMDVWFVKAMIADAAAPALFGVSALISTSLLAIVAASAQALLPNLTQAYGSGDTSRFRRLIKDNFRLVQLLMAFAIMGYTASAPEWMVLVFGVDYKAAWAAGAVLVWCPLFGAMTSVINVALLAGNRPSIRLLTELPMIPLVAGGALLLIPRFGITGAAIATLSAYIVTTLLGIYALRRRFGAGMDVLSIVRIASCAAVATMLGLAWNAQGLMLLIEGAVLCAILLALLAASRELKQADYDRAFGLLRAAAIPVPFAGARNRGA